VLTIKLTRDEITPHLRRLLKQGHANGPLGAVLGRAAANTLRKHFRARNSAGNALGGTRTNFWSRVAESVSSPRTTPGNVVVPITHPAIAQKVFGGTITAKKSRNLAIPIDPRAHGKSPRVFPLLQFALTRAGVKLLGLKENGTMAWLYVLKKSITQERDPKALPPTGQMVEALTTAAEIHLRKVDS
jgi:hypothetical protein